MARIAVDVMGSDLGPAEVVQGAAQLSLETGEIEMLLVGDQEQIISALMNVSHDPRRIQIQPASESILASEAPRKSVQLKPDSSIVVATKMLQNQEVDALVSAGNTGAVVVSAAEYIQRIRGVNRTALAAVYPTEKRHGPKRDPFALMLDVGATLHVDAYDLVIFAIMGAAYAGVISENTNASVALLSNGSEAHKGAPEVVQAHRWLSELELVNFVGNVEGLDIPRGTVDVIVCEGFLGNVALKMLEGTMELVSDWNAQLDSPRQGRFWRLGRSVISRQLRQIRTILDWKQYGGAPLLGFERLIIKAHGRSNARTIRNAIKVAAKASDAQVVSHIQKGISDFTAHIQAHNEHGIT